jgi:uncharacterized membrane protein
MTAGVAKIRALGVLAPLALVSAQVLVDYHTWLISGPDHLYYLRGLHAHPFPYVDVRIEYPVLTGIFMTVPAALTHSIGGYLRLTSLGLWACGAGCTCVLWSISRRAAWYFALCPLLIALSLINWDLFAILLMLLGWRAYTRDRYGAAGVWLALGIFAKLFPVFLFAFCLVELVRRWRSRPAAGPDLKRFALSAIGASVVVNVPFMLLAFGNWRYFWTFNASRNDHSGLLCWLHILDNANIGTTNAVLAAIVCAAAAAGAVAVWRGASVAHVAAVVFFVFMLIEKVYSPQYTLWLVAFALIAEWEAWTIGVLSVVGLVDYANAAVHIALVTHRSSLLRWYEHHIYNSNQGLRSMTILVVILATLYRTGYRQRGSPVAGVETDPALDVAAEPTAVSATTLA